MQQNDAAIPFPDEVAHLAGINQMLDEALAEARGNVEKIDQDYRDAKLYMIQNRSEIDPHEMFQNELRLGQIDQTGQFAAQQWQRMEKLKDSPYFARIDFCSNAGEQDVVYIGRFSFAHENQLRISDWRSPVASMFYDCEVGPAGYTAPRGRIDGQLTLKRQFKIKNGIMEYALESSVNIGDDVLQQELSHTSDEKMKSIISTIQKEQNQIIRNEKAGTLIIQGVAGSGKTSIALHRIAFLLYRFKDRLTAKNVTILSPNKVFGDYISNVLPELGEEPIYEVSFVDIARVQLEGVIGFEPDRDPLEVEDEAWAERVRFKSTLEFVRRMEDFAAGIPERVFEPREYTYGRFTAGAEYIAKRFSAYAQYPVKQRLQMMAEDIYDRFETDNFMGDDMPGRRTILKALKAMLTVKNTMALYKMFYREMGRPKMLVLPEKKTLEWCDVYPFLYIHGAFEGLQQSNIIRHLVIDEMQDYTPIQYAVINRLFQCKKTILGDFGQFINPNHLHTLADLQELYEGADFVALNKSYRSTYEIISFASRIKRTETIDAVERHGEAPAIMRCRDRGEETEIIAERIRVMESSGHTSLGIIVKTNSDARELYELLEGNENVQLLTPTSTSFENGVTITSVQMSKGLEFDQVIIPFADKGSYHTQYDRSLLYVACTRAMHRLDVLYSGEISPLLEPLVR